MQMRVGAYELLRPLGVGGMAETFLAVRNRSVGPAQRVCLKRILAAYAGDPSFLELFSDEAQLLAHMHHPGIVQIYDFGEADGTLYMALELVEGVDLERIQAALTHRKERLQPAVAIFLVSKLLSALDYAHTLAVHGQPLQVVHRDISPSNVLISRRGDVKLTDFGIAKARGRKHRTQSGFTKGKLAYMSPEQVRAHELDARSDLFAVGVVLHELLTGAHPFDAPTEVELLGKILSGDRPRLRSLLRRAPPRLVATIDALLEVDPANRPESAREALQMLPASDRPIDCQRALAGLVRQLEPPGLFEHATQPGSLERLRHAVPRMFSERAPRSAVHEAPTRAYQSEALAHEAPTRADIRAAALAQEPLPRSDPGAPLAAHGSPAHAPLSAEAAAAQPSSGYYPTGETEEGRPVDARGSTRPPSAASAPVAETLLGVFPRPPDVPAARAPGTSRQPAEPAAMLHARRSSRGPDRALPTSAIPTERMPAVPDGLAARMHARARHARRVRGGRPNAFTSRVVRVLFSYRHVLGIAMALAVLLLAAWLYPEPFRAKPDVVPEATTAPNSDAPAAAAGSTQPAPNSVEPSPSKRESAPQSANRPHKARPEPAPKAKAAPGADSKAAKPALNAKAAAKVNASSKTLPKIHEPNAHLSATPRAAKPLALPDSPAHARQSANAKAGVAKAMPKAAIRAKPPAKPLPEAGRARSAGAGPR